jgi:hypothetical protein
MQLVVECHAQSPFECHGDFPPKFAISRAILSSLMSLVHLSTVRPKSEQARTKNTTTKAQRHEILAIFLFRAFVIDGFVKSRFYSLREHFGGP